MNQKQRIIIYITLCYFAMSTVLFFIFITTYSYYFYKNQRHAVLNKALLRQEKNIQIILEKFRSTHGKYEIIQNEYDRMARIMAKSKLNSLIVALQAESDAVPLPKNDREIKKINPADVFIEDNAPILKKEEPLLKPISKNELEKPFIDVFNKIVAIDQESVDLRRFTKGMEQLVDMSYVMVDKQKIKLYKGEEMFEWEIRAYAKPLEQSGDSILEKIEELSQDKSLSLKNITIFRDGEEEPIFKGIASKVEYQTIQALMDKSKKMGKPLHEIPTPFESYQLNQGQEELQVGLRFNMADPKLGICLASSKPIFKSEWMQFSFLERNWQPILAFVLLAWVITPIIAWVAYKMASQFKFKFTVDLEGDEGDYIAPKELRNNDPLEHQSAKVENFYTREMNFESVDHEGDQVEPTVVKANEASNESEIKTSNSSFHELQRQKSALSNTANDSLQLESEEMNNIRANNIRKSTGQFNRHQDDEENTDYLAGVQSDVLKSLIKKLRED